MPATTRVTAAAGGDGDDHAARHHRPAASPASTGSTTRRPSSTVNASAATLTGVLGGDSVAVAGAHRQRRQQERRHGQAGHRRRLTLSGADAGNYTVTDTERRATVDDHAAADHRRPGSTALDRVYDGDHRGRDQRQRRHARRRRSAATCVGVVTGGATGSVANKNVGAAKPVTVVGVGLTAPMPATTPSPTPPGRRRPSRRSAISRHRPHRCRPGLRRDSTAGRGQRQRARP